MKKGSDEGVWIGCAKYSQTWGSRELELDLDPETWRSLGVLTQPPWRQETVKTAQTEIPERKTERWSRGWEGRVNGEVGAGFYVFTDAFKVGRWHSLFTCQLQRK